MIYILAPFNLAINTTSRNRIFSFYDTIKSNGLEVTLINPPLIGRDRELFLNGTIKENKDPAESLKNIPLKENLSEKLVSTLIKKPQYKTASAILNLFYLIVTGKDFNYPSNSLERYYKNHILSENDILIASAPPATLFITARKLAKNYRCKLILDYRDPWTYGYKPIDSMPIINDIKKYKLRKEENKCLKYATLINTDSESVKKLFPKKYHYKINAIVNGANLQVIDLNKIVEHYPIFRIVYLGTIYNDQLLDTTFFSSLKTLIERQNIQPATLEVIFLGSAKNERLHSVIKKLNLSEYVYATERMEISKAMEIAYTASAFLHLKYGDRAEVDASKHLDYLALQKPIVLPLTDKGNLANLIKKDEAGYVCQNEDECYYVLEELWLKHKRGESFRIPRSSDFLYSISREAEANKFVELIKKHCLS